MLKADRNERDHPTRNLILSVFELKPIGATPGPIVFARSATAQTTIYLFGGLRSVDSSSLDQLLPRGSEVHCIHVGKMKFSVIESTSTNLRGIYGHSMDLISGKLVVFGGFLLGDQPTISRKDLHKQRVSNEIYSMDVTEYNDNRIWINPMQSADVFDPSGTQSTGNEHSTRVHRRAFHSSCSMGNELLIYGGLGENLKLFNDLWVCDLKNPHWTQLTSVSTASKKDDGILPTSFAADMVFHDGYVFICVASQRNNESGICLFKCKYEPETAIFVVDALDMSGGPLPAPRDFFSLNVNRDSLVLYGGTSHRKIDENIGIDFLDLESELSCDLYVYDISNGRWNKPLFDGRNALSRGAAVAFLNDKITVYGGIHLAHDCKAPQITGSLTFSNILELKFPNDGFKFKIVTVGDSGVGKTCLLSRFVSDYYSEDHRATIGIDYKSITTMIKTKIVKLQLWDTAGQERFSVITGNYYRNADAFIIAYDTANRKSFEHVDSWVSQIKEHHELDRTVTSVFLVANKFDLSHLRDSVSEEEGRSKASKFDAVFVKVSAKTSLNVDSAFITAAEELLEKRIRKKEKDDDYSNFQRQTIMNRSPGGFALPTSNTERIISNTCQGCSM